MSLPSCFRKLCSVNAKECARCMVRLECHQSPMEEREKILLDAAVLCESQAPDVADDTKDEYRRGQRRAAIECGTLLRKLTIRTPHLRAETPSQKRAIIDRLYTAWLLQPEQRLGQLLDNAVVAVDKGSTFYIEDETLIEVVERFVKKGT